jgi:Phasin protein
MAEATSGTNEFVGMGRKSFDTLVTLQEELLGALQDFNRQWSAGMNAEAKLASELFAKLAGAKSVPEATSACLDCGTRQMEILAENSRGFLAASEKILPQLFGNGFKGGGT